MLKKYMWMLSTVLILGLVQQSFSTVVEIPGRCCSMSLCQLSDDSCGKSSGPTQCNVMQVVTTLRDDYMSTYGGNKCQWVDNAYACKGYTEAQDPRCRPLSKNNPNPDPSWSATPSPTSTNPPPPPPPTKVCCDKKNAPKPGCDGFYKGDLFRYCPGDPNCYVPKNPGPGPSCPSTPEQTYN